MSWGTTVSTIGINVDFDTSAVAAFRHDVITPHAVSCHDFATTPSSPLTPTIAYFIDSPLMARLSRFSMPDTAADSITRRVANVRAHEQMANSIMGCYGEWQRTNVCFFLSEFSITERVHAACLRRSQRAYICAALMLRTRVTLRRVNKKRAKDDRAIHVLIRATSLLLLLSLCLPALDARHACYREMPAFCHDLCFVYAAAMLTRR